MLYISYRPMPTSTNCSGVSRKKTQKRVRWSPGRVGVRVMNSRSAQKEIRPNITTVAAGGRVKAAASSEQSTHQEWTRKRKVSRMAVLMPASARWRSTWTTTVAVPSRINTPPTSPRVVLSSSTGKAAL